MRFASVGGIMLGLGFQVLAQPNVAAWGLLKGDIGHENSDRRKQAVLAAGSIGPAPEVIEILNQALRDKSLDVRKTTAALLGQVKYDGCKPALIAALDDDPEVAVQAAKSLWQMGDRSGRRILEQLYTGEEKEGPGLVGGAMRDAKDKLKHPKKLIVMGINEASGALLGPFAMGIIVAEDMMKDAGAPGRALATDLLSQSCDPHAVQLMNWALDNEKNNLVRAATAKALGKCGNATTVDRLMLMLAESSPAVRDMAAASVVRLSIAHPPKMSAGSGE